MKRRQFIKSMAGAAGAAAGFSMNYPFQPLFKLARAHTPSFGQKTAVVVYLRGGCDGINTVVPHGYGAGNGYYDPGFRPTIAIPEPNLAYPEACLDLGSGSPGDTGNGLGLHPAMSGMTVIIETPMTKDEDHARDIALLKEIREASGR